VSTPDPDAWWDSSSASGEVDRIAKYEHSVVDRIAKRVEFGTSTQAALTGADDLMTFNALYAVTGFPLQLQVLKLKLRQFAELDETLERRPLRTPMFEAFADLRADTAKGTCSLTGIVFGWPRRSPYFILHDLAIPNYGKMLRCWELFGVYCFMETVDNLVERLGPPEEWSG
jgi:hypothetical protein